MASIPEMTDFSKANAKSSADVVNFSPKDAKPIPAPPNFLAIHRELTECQQWVMWNYEKPDDRWTKVPYRPNSSKASTTNPATWSSFAKVQLAYEQGGFDGVGFVTSRNDPFVLIDLDHCLGNAALWDATSIVEIAKREGAYVERSISGTGCHAIGRGAQLEKGRKKNNVEMYTHSRFFTMSGDLIQSPDGPLGTVNETIALVKERLGPEETPAPKPNGAALASDPANDDALIEKARKAKNGKFFKTLFDDGWKAANYKSASEADAALAARLCFWTAKDAIAIERIMRRSALVRKKWDAARGDSTYLKDTIDFAIKHCQATYTLPTSNINDYFAYLPEHKYIFEPSREILWPAASVNSSIAPIEVNGEYIPASQWLDKYRAVQQMTWAPNEPSIIRDKFIDQGGWIQHKGGAIFNRYRPTQLALGNPLGAQRWIDLVNKVYPASADHIIYYLAHRVQRPGEKINQALVLGGDPGTGKDSILEPVKYAVGPWNFLEVQPNQLLKDFNEFAKSVVLRISEARDLGEFDRFAFYERIKIYAAAPPDVIRCNEKHVAAYAVFNAMGVIITTNKKDSLYLPANDRRHFVAWSDVTPKDYSEKYWIEFYNWLASGGTANVYAYLANVDLTDFDPKAPPLKTAAFFAIVDSNRAPEDAELADVLDLLKNPKAVTLTQLTLKAADGDFYEWLKDRRNRRQIPHRLESAGYTPIRNPTAPDDGYWIVGGKRQAIYAQKILPEHTRFEAAAELTKLKLPQSQPDLISEM
jgi:hypothetical protein